MALLSVAHGTQTAVIDTEHALSTQGSAGVYVLGVDTNAMTSGDIIQLKISTQLLHDGTSNIAYQAIFANQQSEPIKYSVPVPVDNQIIVSIQQADISGTAGTGRDFPWSLLKM
jgi:hypothetical protein